MFGASLATEGSGPPYARPSVSLHAVLQDFWFQLAILALELHFLPNWGFFLFWDRNGIKPR